MVSFNRIVGLRKLLADVAFVDVMSHLDGLQERRLAAGELHVLHLDVQVLAFWDVFHYLGQLQEVFAGWTVRRVLTEHHLEGLLDIVREARADIRVATFNNLLVEVLGVCRFEGRPESAHLVENAPSAPDVTLAIIWLISPDLRTAVVWRTCLCVQDARLRHLGHVEIAKLQLAIFHQEDVCALDVPVDDLPHVQLLEAQNHLHEVMPDSSL